MKDARSLRSRALIHTIVLSISAPSPRRCLPIFASATWSFPKLWRQPSRWRNGISARWWLSPCRQRSPNPGPLQFVKAHVKSQIALIRFASAAADLVHGEAEIGSRLLDGDASLRVLPEVLARGGYRSPVFFV